LLSEHQNALGSAVAFIDRRDVAFWLYDWLDTGALVYRDNRLNSIHEGTHGIQAIDLLGRKILRDAGAALRTLEDTVAATIARAAVIAEIDDLSDRLAEGWRRVRETVQLLIDLAHQEAGDIRLDNASLFLTGFGRIVVAWLWLDQVTVLSAPSGGAWTQLGRQGNSRPAAIS
jgi:hypothetical protein